MFKIRYYLIIILTSLFGMVSCAPMTTTFYRPDAPDGRLVSAHCPPVESYILFEKRRVILGAHASKSTDSLIDVTITFEVPEGKVVKLMDQNIYSLLDDQVYASGNLVGRVWVSSGRTGEFLAATPMVGKTENKIFFKQITSYGTTDHAYYFFSAQLSVSDMQSFIIKLPNYSVNDVLVKSPTIRFFQDTKHYIGSLNC